MSLSQINEVQPNDADSSYDLHLDEFYGEQDNLIAPVINTEKLSTKERLKRFGKYFLGISAITAVGILGLSALVGMGVLTYFFVRQFGIDYHLPGLAIDIGGGAISVTVFIAYTAYLVPSLYFALKNYLWRRLFPKKGVVTEITLEEENDQKLENDQVLENVQTGNEKEHRLKKQYRLMIYIGMVLLSLAALAIIGASTYLGVNEVIVRFASLTTHAIQLIKGFGILCSVSMGLVFTAATLDPVIKNLRELFRRKPKVVVDPEADLEARGRNAYNLTFLEKIRYQITRKGSRITLAVLSTTGFAAFKYYSVVSLLKLFGVTATSVVSPIAILSFISLFAMTAVTTGMKINKDFKSHNQKLSQRKITGKIGEIVRRIPVSRKVGRGIGWAVAAATATFMGVGSYMGIVTIVGGFFALVGAAAVPGLNIVAIVIGVVFALARILDFMCFTGPWIVNTFGGQPLRGYDPAADAARDAAERANPNQPHSWKSMFLMFKSKISHIGQSKSSQKVINEVNERVSKIGDSVSQSASKIGSTVMSGIRSSGIFSGSEKKETKMRKYSQLSSSSSNTDFSSLTEEGSSLSPTT